MPRKKSAVKDSAPAARIRENSRLMQTHESMVDFISGRASMGSFLDVLAPSVFAQTYSHLDRGGFTYHRPLEDDLLYSDDDDDDDDDDDYKDCFPHGATHSPLEPHPQIKQLTDEEADKITKELVRGDERRKEKTERNKRKKMRKKEKKRLEKDNQEEDEQEKSDSSENQEEVSIIENTPKVNEAPGGDKDRNSAEGSENSQNKTEGINVGKINKEEEEEEKIKDLVLENSSAAAAGPEKVEETSKLREHEKEPQEERSKLPLEDVKSEAAEKLVVQNKKQEKAEVGEEKTLDPGADELTKRGIELATKGNRLAAAGQFEMAVKAFTDAIKHNPKEFKLFGNRSFCYERIQQYENALRDADVALSMEPSWIKGLFRKGKALCGLKRYYEASLIYGMVLRLESSSSEAAQELKRAQTLHLMEMGFGWAQSTEALKTHGALEQAVEALFSSGRQAAARDAGAYLVKAAAAAALEETTTMYGEDGGWTVQTSRPRTQHAREFEGSRSNSQSPTHRFRNSVKPELFPVWVGTLSAAMTYARLHELFSRTGTIYSIKMLLEQQCAFINYARPEDCDRAIQCIHGMVVDGAPLTVRYPFKVHTELGASQTAVTEPYPQPSTPKKECFFWRTTGCTRSDCTFKHVPEHKNLDREKFTSRLGCGGTFK